MRHQASVLGLVATIFWVAGQPLGAQRRPIIDMHMHAGEPYVPSGELSPCFPMAFCEGRAGAALTDEDLLNETLEAMRRHDIVVAFVTDSLQKINKWYAAAPDRFLRSVHVTDPATADLEVLRRGLESGELHGIGEIGTQYTGFAPSDPQLDQLFALAEEYDQPVLIHLAGTGGPSDRFLISNGHPELLQEVLLKHPRLRIWVENAGFPFLEEIVALMYRYPNVYADLSTTTWLLPRSMFHSYLRDLLNAGLGEKLMFGSDQMQWPSAIDVAIDAIETADFLTEKQKRDIFYNNAARFLGLPEDVIAAHHRG